MARAEVWFTYKRQEYQAAKKRCSDAKRAVARQTPICQVKNRRHIVMVGRCNTKQDFFEKTSCGLSKELSRTCHKYTNCWIDTRHDYLKAKPGIMNMEKDRKGEWRVLKRVACLLDVFASKDGNVAAIFHSFRDLRRWGSKGLQNHSGSYWMVGVCEGIARGCSGSEDAVKSFCGCTSPSHPTKHKSLAGGREGHR